MWTLIKRFLWPLKTYRVDFRPTLRQLNVICMGKNRPLFPFGFVYRVDCVDVDDRVDYLVFVNAIDDDHAIARAAPGLIRRLVDANPA